MTNTSFYLTVLVLIGCMTSSFAFATNNGTLIVHMNTTTRHRGTFHNFNKADVKFDFFVHQIDLGQFGWDNVWSFRPLHDGSFALNDKAGNLIDVKLDESEGTTMDLLTALSKPANSKHGRVSSVASHIGNSVKKAFLNVKVADKKATAEVAGKIAGGVAQKVAQEVAQEVAQKVAQQVPKEVRQEVAQGVAQEVAQEVAKSVARNVTHQLLNASANGFKEIEKQYWKNANVRLFTPETYGFKSIINSKVSV